MSTFPWKRTLWIFPILGLSWAIWKLGKPAIYDISAPEKLAIDNLFTSWHMQPNDTAYIKVGMMEGKIVHWDSITCSSGLIVDEKDQVHSHGIRTRVVKGALPLQTILLWKDGYSYTEVVTIGPEKGAQNEGKDSVFPLGIQLFTQDFDERAITLGVENGKPYKIIALWENFALKGETNGKEIKVWLPASASKWGQTSIRVWCCDSFGASQVVQIPLFQGKVQTKIGSANAIHSSRAFSAEVINSLNISGIGAQTEVFKSMDVLSQNPTYLPILTYGNFRMQKLSNGVKMAITNYFGRKVLVIYNGSNAVEQISEKVKGDFKHTVSGHVFTLKGSRLLMQVSAQSVEVLY
jgi:hypothetical protein